MILQVHRDTCNENIVLQVLVKKCLSSGHPFWITNFNCCNYSPVSVSRLMLIHWQEFHGINNFKLCSVSGRYARLNVSILGECLFISSLPGKALKTRVDIASRAW